MQLLGKCFNNVVNLKLFDSVSDFICILTTVLFPFLGSTVFNIREKTVRHGTHGARPPCLAKHTGSFSFKWRAEGEGVGVALWSCESILEIVSNKQ